HPNWGDAGANLPEESAVPGDMSAARRKRLRRALAEHRQRFHPVQPRVTLTRATIQALGRLEHVAAVEPVLRLEGFALLDGRAEPADVAPARPGAAFHRRRLVAGRFLERPDEK